MKHATLLWWVLMAGVADAETTVTLDTAEYRVVELAKDVNPTEWAERAGIEVSEQIPLAGGGTMLRFAMDEGVWRARRQALCTEQGVASCDTDFCQGYFGPLEDAGAADDVTGAEVPVAEVPVAQPPTLAGRIRMEDPRRAGQTRLVLVPRAPALEALFAEPEATTALTDAVPGASSCAAPAEKSWRFTGASGDGTFSFPQEHEIDRGCWELIAAAQCASRVRPLSGVLPEFEPRRVLAVVNLAQQPVGADPALLNAITSSTGLRVIESTTLASINKAIVRLEIVDPAQDAAAAVNALGAQPGIVRAQHEYRHRTLAPFDDPYAWMNYAIRQSGAERLHPQVLGAGVEVAVIDTGVDATHPELQQRVAASIDVTGFGESADRHGTAVAGIIAAEANNAIGAYGVAPSARLYAIKACQPEQKNAVEGRCWSSTLVKALDAALKRDSHIINLSLSGPHDPLVQEMIEAALENSKLVIAAAGNGGPDAAPSFPASIPGVLAVTAIDARERLYPHATRGEFIDVAAPGVEIPVPVPGGTYPGQLSGTSMATAGVAGIAALLLSQEPNLTGERVREALKASAVPPKRDYDARLIGHGRVDACGAARALEQTIEGCEPLAVAEKAP